MGKETRRWVVVLVVVVISLGSFASARRVGAQSPTPTPSAPAPATGAVELVGAITAFDAAARTIAVNGLTVDVSKAQIAVRLAVGQTVKIEGRQQANGTVLASQVRLTLRSGIHAGEAEISGVVERLMARQMVVNGLTIDIARAQIGAGVAVGATVRVHATLTNAEMWAAREVHVVANAGQPEDKPGPQGTPDPQGTPGPEDKPGQANDNAELVGTLDQIGAGFIVVSGQTIDISTAEIKGTLVVGALVKVHVSMQGGVLTAREVELALNTDDSGDDSGRTGTPRPRSTDDRSGQQPGDDKGGVSQPGDDKGGVSQPGDDKGGASQGGGGASQPGDDKGGGSGGGKGKD
jgi:hypothetical protein